MNPDIEKLNDELLKPLEPIKENKKPIKKNSKKDIINRIFDLVTKNNFVFEITEDALMKKSRKKLLEILADFVEKSIEARMKSDRNNVPPECQENNRYISQLPVLRMAHNFFSSLVEKGFNASASYMDYEYELRKYAETVAKNPLLDDTLLQISEEFSEEIIGLMSSPWIKLTFIHGSGIIGCCHWIDKQQMKSPRTKFDTIKL